MVVPGSSESHPFLCYFRKRRDSDKRMRHIYLCEDAKS